MSEKSTISQMLENHNSDTTNRDSKTRINTNQGMSTESNTSQSGSEQSMKERVLIELESCYHEAPQYVQDTLSLNNIHISITGSFKRVHGKCSYNTTGTTRKKGHYHIQIAKNCISNNANWRDTVRHEFAHAIAYAKHGESQEHNENWKQICRDINAEPTRCANMKHTQEPYQYACPNECWISGKHKRSKKIQKPWQKICGQCKENCVSFDTGEPVPDTPGTCAVESIPWNNRYEYDETKSMNNP